MTPRDFCYWLRGCLELGKVQQFDAAQVEILRKHLDLVFIDVTSDVPVQNEQTPSGSEEEPKEEPKKEILTDERKPLTQERVREIVERIRPGYDPFDSPTTWCSITGGGMRIC